MEKSIFEKIIANEIPSLKVYEDNEFIAILDAYPKQMGHTLVIPKKKVKDFLSEDVDTQKKLIELVSVLSKKIKKNLGASGVKILTNIGESSGQVIFHTHVHIIPYYDKNLMKENNENILKRILK